MKRTWSGKTALVTGASSGIGEAIAKKLAAQGLRVGLAARRLDRLEQAATQIRTAGGQADVFLADLSTENECERLYRDVIAAYGNLDVLVNNAGFGWWGYFDEMPWDVVRDMLAVNIAALVHLTRLALPDMRARRSGHIIQMGSVAGDIPAFGNVIYAATKSFIVTMNTALYRELRRSGVEVSVVCPGPVKTEFFDAAELKGKGGRVPAEQFAVKPEAVSDAVWSLLNRPRRIVHVPWHVGMAGVTEGLFHGIIDRIGPVLLRKR